MLVMYSSIFLEERKDLYSLFPKAFFLLFFYYTAAGVSAVWQP